MKMPYFLVVIFLLSISFTKSTDTLGTADPIGQGGIPNLAIDENNNIHLVFGRGDSILYTRSFNGGRSFTHPEVVDTLTDLFSFAMRGPQVAVSKNKITIIACDERGNIYSYLKEGKSRWIKTARVNDQDTCAKEGLLAFSGDGYLFASWLDMRQGGHNNIYSAKSVDGGKTWSRNKIIYSSPDGHVCECCKPSVIVQGNHVAVMFRNWVQGHRDLYLMESVDGGTTFGRAQKLGKGSWKLNGCPMDGGGVAFNDKSIPQTAWQRNGILYACEPGKEEKEMGMGRSITIATAGNENVYAWVEQGRVVCLLPNGRKQLLGEGSLPVLKVVNKKEVLCVWQQKDSIYKSLLKL
jgi:hypothetical protein